MVSTPVLNQIIENRGKGTYKAPNILNKPPEVSVAKEIKEEKSKLGTAWNWVSKQLMKPVGTVAAETEALGKFIATGKAYIPGKAGLDVLSGKREYSFGQMWSEYGSQLGINPKVSGTVGLIFDMADDPLNFIGGGLTKLGRLAQKVSSLKKAGKTIQVGSKLDKAIKLAGYSADELVLAGTKLEQVSKGQRALLTLAGKPVIGGTKIYQATEKLKNILGVSKAMGGLRHTFTTKTGIQYLDEAVDNFKNLDNYRKQQVLDKAIDIQKTIKKMDATDIKLMVEAIEDPAKKTIITNKTIVKLADDIEDLFKNMKITEKAKGVLKTELENYFPHIKAKEALTDRINHFFNPKTYNATLGAAKQRKILRFISEDGAELVGSADSLGLKPLGGIKGLSHDITLGEFRSLKDIENTLKKYGYSIRYKPQEVLRRRWGGYFDPIKKEIVIASKQPAIENVVNILKHEITHNAHFQLGGNLEMLETFTGRGKAVNLGKRLNVAKDVAKSEWEGILKSRGIIYENLKSSDKVYYRKPTELLAYAMETYVENPDRAISMFPKTIESIKGLKANNKLFNLLDTSVKPEGMKLVGNLFKDSSGKIYQAAQSSVAEINARFGKEFFQSNPAIAYAQRGLASAKAITAREFLDDMGKKFFVNAEDAPISYINSTNPLFKGLKAEPEVVRTIDQYIQGIQPNDLKLVVRGFDAAQNWWKAQALISPSYHIRNMIGNYWNNFLAGVKNPIRYNQAREIRTGKNIKITTQAGDVISGTTLLKEAQQRRVLGRGWYGADIVEKLESEIGITTSKLKKLMPWNRENYLFKTNKLVGEAIENEARLAHFLDKVIKGYSFDDAARSVKKYLFDYEDLTQTERVLFKRVAPFYTWTRKNIPLQLENMVYQTEKYAAIPKVIQRIEAGVDEPESEKYMSSYIRENIPVRIRTNKEGNTEYFLLGNWLPSAQAIDFLSQPLDNLINMASPFIKTPIELWANKSFFFRNTLGEPSKIEYYYKQPTEFLNITMRKKSANLMRNIRILNDINKLIKTPAKDESENSWLIKVFNVLIGKAETYDVSKAKYYYKQETEDRISELKASIKKAQKMGDKNKVQELVEELKQFQKERSQ